MSYGHMESFANGFEDSSNIDFNKMSIVELFGFIDKCKVTALSQKINPAKGPYWLGIGQKALCEVMRREVPQS